MNPPLQLAAILAALLLGPLSDAAIVPSATQNELNRHHLNPLPPAPIIPLYEVTQIRRQFIRDMAKEAWDAIGKSPKGSLKQVVAALSTLWVMDLKEEYTSGRQLIDVETNLFGKHAVARQLKNDGLGALLSAYALSGDESLLVKAQEVADLYRIPALNEGNLLFVLNSWISHKLEARYLADLTGDQEFVQQIDEVETFLGRLSELQTIQDSDSINLNVELKSYLQSNRSTAAPLHKYLQTIKALESTGYLHTSAKFPLTQIRNEHVGTMNIWHCLYGGMLSIGAEELAKLADADILTSAKHHRDLAFQITETCHLAANSTKSGLPYGMFGIDDDATDSSKAIKGFGGYSLEPALAETYFVLYRLTGDPKFQNYAWELAQAIYQHARVPGQGYSSVKNCDKVPVELTNPQQQPAEFLSGTLKYLYLTFTPDNYLPLDQWVFNVMGHPLPVCGKSAAYPKSKCAGL